MLESTVREAWTLVKGLPEDTTHFGRWIRGIAVRTSVRHLEKQGLWGADAQIRYQEDRAVSTSLAAEVEAIIASRCFGYDVHEHIAYCFTCVGRSIPPGRFAVIIMHDVLGLSVEECAATLELGREECREALTLGREEMSNTFSSICGLAGGSSCNECDGFRSRAREGDNGPELPDLTDDWPKRLSIVVDSEIDAGRSQLLHDILWRRTADAEAERQGRRRRATPRDALRTT